MKTLTRFPKRTAKPIKIDGFKGKYLITRSGRILNTVTGNEIKSFGYFNLKFGESGYTGKYITELTLNIDKN